MIERLWYGWTAPEDADEYERLLREEILPGFADDLGEGLRGYRVLRRDREAADGNREGTDGNRERAIERDESEEIEFVTVLQFDSLDTVREFAGEDYRQAHVPPEASKVLSRFDDRARHYEVRTTETN